MSFPYNSPPSITIQGSTSAYAANQVIGTGVNRATPAGRGGLLQTVSLVAKSTVSAQVDLMFFNSSMPNTTFTDHSSIAISSQDAANCIGVVPITNWSYGGTACTVGTAYGLAFQYGLGTGLYFSAVARAALIVNSTSDFTVMVTLLS